MLPNAGQLLLFRNRSLLHLDFARNGGKILGNQAYRWAKAAGSATIPTGQPQPDPEYDARQ